MSPGEAGTRGDTTAPGGMLGILAVLTAHEVEFVVIGGFAVAFHGFPRATKDVDIVPAPDARNIAKLWNALLELEARPLALGDLHENDLAVPLTHESLLLGGNRDLVTSHGRIDVMQYREGALESPDDYRNLRAGAVSEQFEFGPVWFVGYEDLLDLKLLAGRDQDLIDIRALREARGDAG